MNIGCMAPFEVRNLHVFSVSMFVSDFFSFRNTRAENAGKLPRLVEGRERAGRNTWGANSSGSRARHVIKPTGCNTEGVMGGDWPGIQSPLSRHPSGAVLLSTGWGERVPSCAWLVVLSRSSQHLSLFLDQHPPSESLWTRTGLC